METSARGPLFMAGLLLGIGFGGFFDGILFHQLLQWHHMLTAHDGGRFPMNTVSGLETNTLWDGIFHTVCWLALAAGFFLLWRLDRRYRIQWSGALLGAMLMGWGGFNLVEGLVDHHILGIHHVRDDKGGPVEWDLGFLAWGAVFLGAGWILTRRGRGLAEINAATPDTQSA